jgi:hypothetical protein
LLETHQEPFPKDSFLSFWTSFGPVHIKKAKSECFSLYNESIKGVDSFSSGTKDIRLGKENRYDKTKTRFPLSSAG